MLPTTSFKQEAVKTNPKTNHASKNTNHGKTNPQTNNSALSETKHSGSQKKKIQNKTNVTIRST